MSEHTMPRNAIDALICQPIPLPSVHVLVKMTVSWTDEEGKGLSRLTTSSSGGTLSFHHCSILQKFALVEFSSQGIVVSLYMLRTYLIK